MDKFYQNDKKPKSRHLHSLGAKYDFKNDLVLEAAFGQAEGKGNVIVHFAVSQFDIAGSPLSTSYQFPWVKTRSAMAASTTFMTAPRTLQALTFAIKWAVLIYAP